MSDQPQTRKQPEITHSDGAVFAKVWENQSQKGGVYYNVTSGKYYTDPKSGETRVTHNLQKSDLPKMQFVMGEAYRSISLLQQNIKQENAQEQQNQAWLNAPEKQATPSQSPQNGTALHIENGRSQSPEM